MIDEYRTVKRFAWKKTKLSDNTEILWKFYYEKRKYDTYVDLEKYNAWKNGDPCYRFPRNIITGRYFFDGFTVVKRFTKHIH